MKLIKKIGIVLGNWTHNHAWMFSTTLASLKALEMQWEWEETMRRADDLYEQMKKEKVNMSKKQ